MAAPATVLSSTAMNAMAVDAQSTTEVDPVGQLSAAVEAVAATAIAALKRSMRFMFFVGF